MLCVSVISTEFTPPYVNGSGKIEGANKYVPLLPHPDISVAVVPDCSSKNQKPIGLSFITEYL